MFTREKRQTGGTARTKGKEVVKSVTEKEELITSGPSSEYE